VKLLYKKLSALGYQIIQARRGKEALNKAKVYFPDIILMDIVLPDIHGSEVVKVLKQDRETARIPVIFLSGIVTKDENQESIVNVGSEEYPALPKPFTLEELLTEIRKVIP
jgi:DNA-binding response OmpR family regulator